MGITGAVIAVAWALTAIFSGIFLSISSKFPNLLRRIVGLIIVILLFFLPCANLTKKKE